MGHADAAEVLGGHARYLIADSRGTTYADRQTPTTQTLTTDKSNGFLFGKITQKCLQCYFRRGKPDNIRLLTYVGGLMPSSNEVDQCPFCNAPWGTCLHIRLLLEWEKEALAREAQEELKAGRAADSEAQATKSKLKH